MPKPLENWQAEDAARLKKLYEDRTPMNQADFGAEYGIGTQGMVWQYLNGKRPLNVKAAIGFAKGLNVKIDEFSPALASDISEAYKYVNADGEQTSSSPWPFTKITGAEYKKLGPDDKRDVESLLDSKAQKIRSVQHKSAA